MPVRDQSAKILLSPENSNLLVVSLCTVGGPTLLSERAARARGGSDGYVYDPLTLGISHIPLIYVKHCTSIISYRGYF